MESGADELKDLDGFEQSFVESLALPDSMMIKKKKLLKKLGVGDGGRKASGGARKASLVRSASRLTVIAGQNFQKKEQLACGNATIWVVQGPMGDDRVLKECSAECVKAEIDARKALGWDLHSATCLKVTWQHTPSPFPALPLPPPPLSTHTPSPPPRRLYLPASTLLPPCRHSTCTTSRKGSFCSRRRTQR